ncbi:hypothetical protein KSZ_70280 [Dictyobacter formicarum]|uniref:Uncharacterized protein n=1 Tax=Dictyobacter formicarum TaxID=2778368 RepID=A0ABQ3VRX2_9CHLR|nr:hypothetical protein KSZ_70280 [Dictyobacter formicarum]
MMIGVRERWCRSGWKGYYLVDWGTVCYPAEYNHSDLEFEKGANYVRTENAIKISPLTRPYTIEQ